MKTATFRTVRQICVTGTIILSLCSCSSLLPRAKQETQTPWRSYAEAQDMFVKILPGKTSLTELKVLGIDPEKTPNVALLSHADLMRRLSITSSTDMRLLDPDLQPCVVAYQACFGYEIEQFHLDRQRRGNFWLDFLSFDRKADVTGWQFDAVVVIKDNTVIYKMWSGKSMIQQREEEHSPLGPFQGFGPSLLTR